MKAKQWKLFFFFSMSVQSTLASIETRNGATFSQLSLTSITLNVYFNGSESELSFTSKDSFEKSASDFVTNYTKHELDMNKLHSVEEAVYEAIYWRSLLTISSQRSCGMQDGNCLSMQMSPAIEFHAGDYFYDGNEKFKKLIDYYTSSSFRTDQVVEDFVPFLQNDPNLNSIVNITIDSSTEPEEVSFDDNFAAKIDENVLYEWKEDDIFMSIVKSPMAAFLFSTVAIFVGSMYVLYDTVMFDKKNDLLNDHIKSSSQAMTSITTSMETSQNDLPG